MPVRATLPRSLLAVVLAACATTDVPAPAPDLDAASQVLVGPAPAACLQDDPAVRLACTIRRALDLGNHAPLAEELLREGALLWALDRRSPDEPTPLASLVVDLLVRSATGGGDESALVALAALAASADGWYGEAVEDALCRVFRNRPDTVVSSWPRLESFETSLGFESTDCSRDELLGRYEAFCGPARPCDGVLAFLRTRAPAAP